MSVDFSSNVQLLPNREETYIVKSYDTWADGSLKISALLGIFQELAYHHSASLGWGFEQMKANHFFWAMHRFEMHIKQLPKWEDPVITSTWIKGTERLFAKRAFALYNVTGEEIVQMDSIWLLVDTNSRRPKKAGIIMDQLPSISYEDELTLSTHKIKPAEHILHEASRKVQHSDLDFNMHVNNTKYADWLMDVYPLSFLENNRLSKITLHYLKEIKHPETVSIQITGSNEDSLKHQVAITTNSDQTTALLGEFEWESL